MANRVKPAYEVDTLPAESVFTAFVVQIRQALVAAASEAPLAHDLGVVARRLLVEKRELHFSVAAFAL